MNKIIEDLYKNSVNTNLEEINRILISENNVNQALIHSASKDLLIGSSNSMINKWKSGKKYLRTSFMLKIFGNKYPDELLNISLYIDSCVNILDDLLDEVLTNEQKSLNIFEFTRIFSLLISDQKLIKFQSQLGTYLSELIILATSERIYLQKVNSENVFDKLVQNSYELLELRALDIDIFVDIPLSEYSFEDRKSIKMISRKFRAFNLLKKDVFDLNHDRGQGQNTALISILDKGINIEKYIEAVIEKVRKEIGILEISDMNKVIKDRFINLLEDDIRIVTEYITNQNL